MPTDKYSAEYIHYIMSGTKWRATDWNQPKFISELETDHLENILAYLELHDTILRYYRMATLWIAKTNTTETAYKLLHEHLSTPARTWMLATPLYKRIKHELNKRKAAAETLAELKATLSSFDPPVKAPDDKPGVTYAHVDSFRYNIDLFHISYPDGRSVPLKDVLSTSSFKYRPDYYS